MKSWIETRLAELKQEREAGQQMLAELRARQTNIEQTLLRIDGAIEVLEEQVRAAQGESSSEEAT